MVKTRRKTTPRAKRGTEKTTKKPPSSSSRRVKTKRATLSATVDSLLKAKSESLAVAEILKATEANELLARKIFLCIFSFQTRAERKTGTSVERNGLGFGKLIAAKASALGEKLSMDETCAITQHERGVLFSVIDKHVQQIFTLSRPELIDLLNTPDGPVDASPDTNEDDACISSEYEPEDDFIDDDDEDEDDDEDDEEDEPVQKKRTYEDTIVVEDDDEDDKEEGEEEEDEPIAKTSHAPQLLPVTKMVICSQIEFDLRNARRVAADVTDDDDDDDDDDAVGKGPVTAEAIFARSCGAISVMDAHTYLYGRQAARSNLVHAGDTLVTWTGAGWRTLGRVVQSCGPAVFVASSDDNRRAWIELPKFFYTA